ncbi:MAG: hypothetical protein ACOVMM_04520 [Chitinophagaceae bacterium]
MKFILFSSISCLMFFTCNKTTTAPTNEVDIKIIHSTCVQTIAKVITPNSNVGVNWSKNGVMHQNAFNLGVLNPIRVDSVNQVFRVKILSSATYSQVLCALADVPGTNVFHDVEKL